MTPLSHKRVVEMTPDELERRRVSKAASTLRKYRRNLAIVHEFKAAHSCADCGRDDLPPEILHLDHRDPALKSFTIANRLASRGADAVRAECEKCDVRCPTCHALRHYLEKQMLLEVDPS